MDVCRTHECPAGGFPGSNEHPRPGHDIPQQEFNPEMTKTQLGVTAVFDMVSRLGRDFKDILVFHVYSF